MNIKLIGGFAIILGLSMLFHFLQWEHGKTLAAQLASANTSLATAKDNAKVQGESASSWQTSAETCAKKNSELSTRNANLEAANALAAAHANKKAKEAAAQLDAWQKRYNAAMKNGTCADILNTPLTVCPELTQ